MNRCSACRWCRPDRSLASFFGLTAARWEFAKCARPEYTPVDESYAGSHYCTIERTYACGAEGKFWEAA